MSNCLTLAKTVKTMIKLACVLLGMGLFANFAPAQTDGGAKFETTIAHYRTSGSSSHWTVVWVTSPTGNFVTSIRKQGPSMTGSDWKNHCGQWITARGSASANTQLDGYSSATATTYSGTNSPVIWTWDCRDANSNLVPDGTYTFWLQYAEDAGQGPYTTNGMVWTKGSTAATNTYADMGYMTARKVTWTPLIPSHDISVLGITPPEAMKNTNVMMTVVVTNKTSTTESYSVVLSNTTSSTLIGTYQVNAMSGNSRTNVTIQWNTPSQLGNYILRATAGPLAGETNTSDNVFSVSVAVVSQPHDIAVISMSPNLAPPNTTNVTVSVLVANETVTTESFSVVLSNLTAGILIGSQSVNNMAGNTATLVTFPWDTTGLSGNNTLQATAGPVVDEPISATADNTMTNVVTVRPLVPDVAITGVSAPTLVPPNSAGGITVVAANMGESPQSFNVQLWDVTKNRFIGPMWQIPNLHVGTSVNLPLSYTTTNGLIGYHTLRAVASPVATELVLTNNTNLFSLVVAYSWNTNALVARGSTWHYNDLGLDLTPTPWLQTNYYDSTWSAGAAPLGYSENGLLTNITTIVGWGASATNKNSTTYFRQAFNVDWLPESLTLNLRCVDGLACYLNGIQVARYNMSSSVVNYATPAATAITGPAQYSWITLNPDPTNIIHGNNVLAVEVHKASVAASDLALDVELLGVMPQIPGTHDVDAISLSTPDNVLVGDQMPVTVKVVNRGNVTETVLVLLVNSSTGQIVGSQTITGLLSGDSANVNINWSTLGSSIPGLNQLVAYTVVNGVTNFAGVYTNTAMISGSVFATNSVNASGAIGGRCSAIAASGNLLLVGAGAALQVWNRSIPAAPAQVGTVRLPGLIRDIAVSGSYAFAACGNAGVAFVDLGDPANPVHRLTMNTSGNAYSAALSGNTLCVADGVAGLRLVNVASPTAPVLAGAYYTQGPARAVKVVGSTAYVLDQEQGLLVLDVSNPAAPALIGSYSGFDSAQALDLSGSAAFVVDGNNHFYRLDVANPATPALVSSLLLANQVGQALTVNGTVAYVTAGDNGLLAIDVSAPSTNVLLSTSSMPGEAAGLTLAGSKLYVADGLAGFQVFDASTPRSPALQADFPVGLRGSDVAVTNSMVYVASGESGLRIFSLANPAAPSLLGRFTGVTNARSVAVSGTTAYVGDGQYGLKIVDVSTPQAPALLGIYANTNLASIRNVGVSGSLVVLSDGRTALLVDVSNPASPTLVGAYATPAFAFSLRVANNKAYLACGSSGIVILNVSSGGISLLGTYAGNSPYLATDIAISGTTAYATYAGLGWAILDVSIPSAPSLVKLSTAQGSASTIAAVGSLVTLFGGSSSAVTVDASTPLTPVQKSTFGPLVSALRLAATSSLLVSAEDEAGLAILNTAVNVILVAQPATDRSSISLKWNSVAGQTYTVYKSTDLRAGFSMFRDNVTATPPLNTITDNMSSEAAFYIITVH